MGWLDVMAVVGLAWFWGAVAWMVRAFARMDVQKGGR